jgi:hypothetical protein
MRMFFPFPLLFKRAERQKIAQWAILAKEPACRERAGIGLRCDIYYNINNNIYYNITSVQADGRVGEWEKRRVGVGDWKRILIPLPGGVRGGFD